MLVVDRHPFLQKFKLPDISDPYNLNVLREDLVQPFTGGNKWRKLKYNLIDFREQKKSILLTFGGAFSNHLIACAAAGSQLGIKTIGIIRGEEISNPCIDFMKAKGMKLFFVSRDEYRRKTELAMQQHWLEQLIKREWVSNEAEVFLLPEGGSNEAAVVGTKEIAKEITDELIFCACGTGATVAGISNGISKNQIIHAVPVLKSKSFIENNIADLGGDLSKIVFHHDYHFGGYAKKSFELDKFCRDFYLLNHIQIEPVYTGKLFFAIQDLLKRGTFPIEKSMTAIHTGGIYSFFPF